MNYIKAKGNGKDSHFEMNLLHYVFSVLNEAEISAEIRYQASLILASLQDEEITSFLTQFLKSNIDTKGINDLLRDFLVLKNNEVL